MFAASRAELRTQELPDATLDYLQRPDWRSVAQDLAWLDQPDHHLLDWNDPRYPPLLRQIARPPPLLFVHGDADVLRRPQLAIVGTRHPTPGGRDNAQRFAAHLAGCDLLITSGLALGIDAAAHQGALTTGQTLAVMGSSLDQVYPARHRDLARAIAARGALVSELPLGTPPLAENFPRRNRLISGLALGVLVVEAAVHSGSLITARLAAEQGREVFAIPGSIHNPLAKGCHALIRQGAKLVETAADILEELGTLAAAAHTLSPATQSPAPASPPVAPPVAPLAEEYQQLLIAMGNAPVSVDVLADQCGLTAEALSSMLLILELEGRIAALPGGWYQRLPV